MSIVFTSTCIIFYLWRVFLLYFMCIYLFFILIMFIFDICGLILNRLSFYLQCFCPYNVFYLCCKFYLFLPLNILTCDLWVDLWKGELWTRSKTTKLWMPVNNLYQWKRHIIWILRAVGQVIILLVNTIMMVWQIRRGLMI